MADSKFTIEIETEAKTKQVEELTKKIAELEKKLQTTKKETSDFEGQLRHLETSLAQIGGKTRIASEGIFQFFNSMRGFENLSEVFGSLAASGFIPLIAGATALVGALEGARESLAAFMKVEQAMVGVDAALAQKGMLSGEMRERIQGLAEELRNTTNIAASQWLPVLSRLIQFGADESNIDKYSDAVKNLAGIMGGDIETAAHLFTRVMQGNVEMLHRYGIRVAEGATTTETLNNAMAEIARVGAGQLEARAETLTGKMRGLKVSVEEVFERFGSGISSTGLLQGSIQLLTDVVDGLKDHFQLVIPQLDKLTNSVVNHGLRVEDAKEAWSRFKKEQEDAEALTKTALDASNEQFQVDAEMLKLRRETAKTEREILKLRIDEAAEAGTISHAEAARRKGVIDQEGAAEEAGDKLRALENKSQKSQRDADIKAQAVSDLQKRLADKESQLASPQIGVQERRQEQLRQAREKLKLLDTPSGFLANMPLGGLGPLAPFVDAYKGMNQQEKAAAIAALKNQISGLEKITEPVQKDASGRIVTPREILGKGILKDKENLDKARRESDEAQQKADSEADAAAELGRLQKRASDAKMRLEQEKATKDIQKGSKEDERDAERDFKQRGFNKFQIKGGLSDALDSYHQANMDALAAVATRISEQQRDLEAVTSRVNDSRLS